MINKATIDIIVRTVEFAVCIFDVGCTFHMMNKQETDKQELIDYLNTLSDLNAKKYYLEGLPQQQKYIDDKITKTMSIRSKYGIS